LGGGNPQAADNQQDNVRGLAVRFDNGNCAFSDLVMISVPVFFAQTPALFIESLQTIASMEWAALAMIGAGLLISAAWLGITVRGWSAMKRHADLAAKFASARFKHLPNALDETLCDRAQTDIHHLVLLVIAVFMLMYLGLGYIRFALVSAASPASTRCCVLLTSRVH
jgi:hypothetical protein